MTQSYLCQSVIRTNRRLYAKCTTNVRIAMLMPKLKFKSEINSRAENELRIVQLDRVFYSITFTGII